MTMKANRNGPATWLRGLAPAALSALLLGADPALADPPSWENEPYPYTVVDQDVRDALEEFGRNLDIGVTVSDDVQGRLRGPWTSKTTADFLGRVSDELNVAWFYDGHRLHVSSAAESTSEALRLQGVEPEAWRASLDRLGIGGNRSSLSIDADQKVALVSGPPGYVALIKDTLPKAAPRAVRRVNVIYGRKQPGDAS